MRSERVDADGRVIVDDDDATVRETLVLSDKDLREAYERGRRDEAGRHRRNWLLTILTWLLALFGVVVLALAALNGSFQRGGAVIDKQLSIAADQAEPMARNAVSEASEAVQDARLPAVPTDDPEIPVTPTDDPSIVQTQPGQTTTTTTTTAPEAR
jgi:hypothetical protein